MSVVLCAFDGFLWTCAEHLVHASPLVLDMGIHCLECRDVGVVYGYPGECCVTMYFYFFLFVLGRI